MPFLLSSPAIPPIPSTSLPPKFQLSKPSSLHQTPAPLHTPTMCICPIVMRYMTGAHNQFQHTCPYHWSERRAQNVAAVRLAWRNLAPIQDTSSRVLINDDCPTPVFFVPNLPLEGDQDQEWEGDDEVVLSREANDEMSRPASPIPSSPVLPVTPPNSPGVVLTPPSTPPTPRITPSEPSGAPTVPSSLSMLDAPTACDCDLDHCDGGCEELPRGHEG
jgi:hypothetical protein